MSENKRPKEGDPLPRIEVTYDADNPEDPFSITPDVLEVWRGTPFEVHLTSIGKYRNPAFFTDAGFLMWEKSSGSQRAGLLDPTKTLGTIILTKYFWPSKTFPYRIRVWYESVIRTSKCCPTVEMLLPDDLEELDEEDD